jgi:hypothetical protein
MMINVEKLVSDLQHTGYSVIRDHVQGRKLLDIQSEFDRFISSANRQVSAGKDAVFPTSIKELQSGGMESLATCLSPGWLSKCGTAYFNSENVLNVGLASLVTSNSQLASDSSANELAHWDPALELRLIIYISDAFRGTGALEVKPGTQNENHRHRIDFWRHNHPFIEQPLCAGEANEFHALEGKAGTAILFDTGLTHRRGYLTENAIRKAAFSFVRSPLAELFYLGANCPTDKKLLWSNIKKR